MVLFLSAQFCENSLYNIYQYYTTTNASVSCGGQYEGANNTISSPNYPNNYTSDAFCVYSITVPTGRACVEFVNLNTEPLLDFVSVFDGTSLANVPIRVYVC